MCKQFVIWTLCLSSQSAYAGPEADAGYKSLISYIAVIGLIVAHCSAVGLLSGLLGRGYWHWCIAQLAASTAGLLMFLKVLSLWMGHPDMSVLDILLTDLIFETWAFSNLLLFAAGFTFSVPVIILAILCFFNSDKSRTKAE